MNKHDITNIYKKYFIGKINKHPVDILLYVMQKLKDNISFPAIVVCDDIMYESYHNNLRSHKIIAHYNKNGNLHGNKINNPALIIHQSENSIIDPYYDKDKTYTYEEHWVNDGKRCDNIPFRKRYNQYGDNPPSEYWYINSDSYKRIDFETYKRCEIYFTDDEIMNLSGPAVIEYYGNTDKKQTEMWYMKKGILHRDDGPAIITYHNYDNKFHQILYDWFKYMPEQQIFKQTWFRYGKLHREDGPAMILRHPKFYREEYYINGKLHREDGPAKFSRYLKTNKRQEVIRMKYYINGQLHRENGPAQISNSINDIPKEVWCLNGEYINDPPNHWPLTKEESKQFVNKVYQDKVQQKLLS